MSETGKEMDLELVTSNIRSRRSVKPVDMDSARQVDQDLLVTLLENANHAPSHGLTEPWRFTIFQGQARQELADKLQKLYKQLTPEGEFREDKMTKMGQNPLLAPVIISIGMDRQLNGKIPELEEIEAVACAVQNLHLSAMAAGLGGFWSSPPIVDSEEFREWVGLSQHGRCLGLFYLGWPKPGFNWPRAVRRPVEQKLQWRGQPS